MDKHISRQFFNEGAAHWDEEAHIKDVKKMRAMADRLEIPPFAAVLDVGTGTGVFVPFLQTKLDDTGRIICLDFAFLMLEKAVVKHGNQRVDYVCAEIETTIFQREYFDVIVCYSTFPHFHDKPLAMRNMHALLKEGGRLYVCHTAHREFINNIHRSVPALSDHLIPENDAMGALLENAGFVDVSVNDGEDAYLVKAIK